MMKLKQKLLNLMYLKYDIDIWKTELDESIELLMNKCDKHQKEKISEAQNEWEESLLLQMEMEKEILFDDIGRGMIVKWLSKYKDEYRYRTFEIMYLSYYIDLWDIPKTQETVLCLDR